MSGIKPLLNTSKKYIKFNFFRTLEINQRLTIIRRVFVQKNWQNLSNNRDGRHLTLLPEAPRSALGAVASRRGRSRRAQHTLGPSASLQWARFRSSLLLNSIPF